MNDDEYYAEAFAALVEQGDLINPCDEPVVVRLDTAVRKQLQWLWIGRLAAGKLCIIDGDPDNGKSSITCDLAARVSTGSPMPGEYTPVPPAGVVICCAEDDIEDTIVPRLDAHGANRYRIGTIPLRRDMKGQLIPLVIPNDLARVEAAILEMGATLLIIDPITAYLPESIQTHNDASVRRALTPLADLAQRTGCCILLVRHLNKSPGGSAIYRGGGSIAFSGAARSVLVVGKDPDDEDKRILARVKGNLYSAVPSLSYSLVYDEVADSVKVQWNGDSKVTAEQLLAGKDKRLEAPVRDEAEDAIRDILSLGPENAGEVIKAVMGSVMCSEKTVKLAARKMGVGSLAIRGDKGYVTSWIWSLPGNLETGLETPQVPARGNQGPCINTSTSSTPRTSPQLEALEVPDKGHGEKPCPRHDITGYGPHPKCPECRRIA